MVSTNSQRKLLSAFSLNTPLILCEEEIAFWLNREARIKLAVRHMLAGNISSSQLLEICAESVPCVDEYLDVVEDNLVFDGLEL